MSESETEGAGNAGSLARSTALMASGTAVSRVLGFVRSATLVAAIGVNTLAADAFDTANNLPNFLYAIIAGGVLNAILVPQIVRAYRSGQGKEYVDRLLTLATATLAVLTLILTASAGLLVKLYANPNWTQAQLALGTAFAIWCVPQVFFYGMYTLLGQVLNARGSFGPYMWAPVVNNVVSIAGFGMFIVIYGKFPGTAAAAVDLSSWDAPKIALIGGTATLGVALQAAVLLWPLHRIGFRWRPRWGLRGSGLRSAGHVAIWTVGALIVDQMGVWLANKLASGTRTAAMNMYGPAIADSVAGNAALNIALMLYVLPHSLVTVSLTTALFTRMSSSAERNDKAAVRADLSVGFRTTGVFTVFATMAWVVLALPLTRALQPTASKAEVEAISQVLVALSIGLVPLGMTLLMKRVYYAFEDGKTVFMFQLPMTAIFMTGALLSVVLLPPTWWVVGIAASQTLSYIMGVAMRMSGLTRLLHGVDGKRVFVMHAKAVLAAVLAGEAGWLLLHVFPDMGGSSVVWGVTACAVVGIVMAVLYYLLLKVLQVHELADFLRPFASKLSRLRGARK